MAEQELSWYLFGAQAAIVWGSPRLTADVDITASIEPAAVASFIETMTQHGFHLLFTDSDFLTRTHVLPFVHRRTCMGARCWPGAGDPIDTGPLDSFAFEVHERFRKHDRAPA